MTIMRLAAVAAEPASRAGVSCSTAAIWRGCGGGDAAVRGDRIGMIFQEPMTSLNPTLTIGFQIAEVLRRHRGMGAKMARVWASTC